MEETRKENYYDAIKEELIHLKDQMIQDKKEDINKYEDQIRYLLKLDIVTRYYFQKGKAEASLDGDKELALAVTTLKDPQRYQDLLSGKYIQPKEDRIQAQAAEDEETDFEPVGDE